MTNLKGAFPFPIEEIKSLEFNAKTGEPHVDVSMQHPVDGRIPWRLMFSQAATQSLALALARTHKFLDEQIAGKSEINGLQYIRG